MRKLILLTVLTLGATAARAENGLFYLGAGFSYNSVTNISDLIVQNNSGNINGGAWKAFAGVRPINLFAVEADYMDLGSGNGTYSFDPNGCASFGPPCEAAAHSDGSAYAGYLVGFLPVPLPVLDIFAKAGAAHWKLDGSLGALGGGFGPASFSNSGTDFAWGIGVQAHISMFGGRLEYEQFNIPNTSGAKIASLSAFVNF
jgi:hypothetical protein